jgi:hypothetical protein
MDEPMSKNCTCGHKAEEHDRDHIHSWPCTKCKCQDYMEPKMRPMSLVEYNPEFQDKIKRDIEEGHIIPDCWRDQFYFLGEIPNRKGHGLFITKDEGRTVERLVNRFQEVK